MAGLAGSTSSMFLDYVHHGNKIRSRNYIGSAGENNSFLGRILWILCIILCLSFGFTQPFCGRGARHAPTIALFYGVYCCPVCKLTLLGVQANQPSLQYLQYLQYSSRISKNVSQTDSGSSNKAPKTKTQTSRLSHLISSHRIGSHASNRYFDSGVYETVYVAQPGLHFSLPSSGRISQPQDATVVPKKDRRQAKNNR